MTNVSLKINPDPDICAITLLPSAWAIDGDRIRADVRNTVAMVFAIIFGNAMRFLSLLVVVIGSGLFVLIF